MSHNDQIGIPTKMFNGELLPIVIGMTYLKQ